MDPSEPTDHSLDPGAERLAEYAARTRATESPDDTNCPDPGVLDGFAEATSLLPREQARVEEHLARCEACRVAVAELVRDRMDPALAEPVAVRAEPARILRPRRFAFAAAAAILVAALVVHGITRDGSTSGTQEALVASAHDLTAARPDLFGGFEPLRPGEVLVPASAQKRGALALFAPAGKVLDTRPEFRWEAVAGVERWRVSLRAADGELLWSVGAKGPSIAFPAERAELGPGTRYIWEASGDGPLGPEGSRRAFDVVSADERRALDEAGREIDARAPSRLRPLLRAQFALRRGLFAAAAGEAERFLVTEPTDPVARETLAAAQRALGLADGGSEDR